MARSNFDRYQRIAPFYDLLDLVFEHGRYRRIRPLLFEALAFAAVQGTRFATVAEMELPAEFPTELAVIAWSGAGPYSDRPWQRCRPRRWPRRCATSSREGTPSRSGCSRCARSCTSRRS